VFQQIDSLPKAMLAAFIGIFWLLMGQYLIVGMARSHATFAGALLGPTRRGQADLEARIESLQESRSSILEVGVRDRQQIERDLHDGAQQRLISLALHLGMAKAKLATDPAAAQSLVTAAHEEAKQTLAEIRDLVRGIYPPILADRGLSAAISSLVSRCSVPVTTTIAVEERLPEAIESTAYFLVAEALTNVTKHSQATEAWVEVRRHDDHVLIAVGDNGQGGADPDLGTGLAGLSARVAALDGQWTVSSPPQGPTILTGDLPCAL
jgi:signal transduction histidine kinase